MSARASLYVHAPFCRAKCRYCAFFSAPTGAAGPEHLAACFRSERIGGRDQIFPRAYEAFLAPSAARLGFELQAREGCLLGAEAREWNEEDEQ